MSDFLHAGWGLYVAIASLVSVLGCGVFLFVVARTKVPKAAPNAGPQTTGHVWDEDLAEFNNPLPRWWMWLFYITIVFSLVYLVLYPGLGKFPGVLGWTSVGQYQAERKAFDERIAPLYAKYLAMDVPAVAADPEAQAMGERLFLTYCAQCHGSDAGGSRGIPNLRDGDWLYGGAPAVIKTSILDGRNGVMPPFGAVLGEDGVSNVVNYVRSLSGLPHDSLKAQLGKPLFAANCAACHGGDGKGNAALGAPNLTDNVWLYGSSPAMIAESINNGRGMAGGVSRMPPHKDILDDGKVQLLAAYVWGLSNKGGAKQ